MSYHNLGECIRASNFCSLFHDFANIPFQMKLQSIGSFFMCQSDNLSKKKEKEEKKNYDKKIGLNLII